MKTLFIFLSLFMSLTAEARYHYDLYVCKQGSSEKPRVAFGYGYFPVGDMSNSSGGHTLYGTGFCYLDLVNSTPGRCLRFFNGDTIQIEGKPTNRLALRLHGNQITLLGLPSAIVERQFKVSYQLAPVAQKGPSPFEDLTCDYKGSMSSDSDY